MTFLNKFNRWLVSSTEVCYLDTNIKTGDNTPFRISIYNKREDFAFRIVNFPHMDRNIPANPAYGVYSDALAREARLRSAMGK